VAHRALALDEETHVRPVHDRIVDLLQVVIVPGEEFGPVKVGLREQQLRCGEGGRPGHEQLLGPAHSLVAHEVAAQVQRALSPSADRHHRNVDLVELPERRAAALPIVVQRMGVHFVDDPVAPMLCHRQTVRHVL